MRRFDKPSVLTDAATRSHGWALRHARLALYNGLSKRDRTLPALAERRVLQIPCPQGPQEARLYRPAGVNADAPLLLFFHGGGFVVSDLDTHEALCIRLAAAAGMRVLSASYRMAPEHKYPAQMEDALAATRWILRSFDDGRAATEGLVIGGDSAGAYLALLACAGVREEFPDAIRAQLLLYPLLTMDEDAWAKSLLRETRLIGWAAVRYIRAQLFSDGATAPSLVDAHDLPRLATIIVSGGVLDPVREHSRKFADNMRQAGAPVRWLEYPKMIHGFANLTYLSGATRRAVAEIGEALGETARTTGAGSF